jgi:hypothetical protein
MRTIFNGLQLHQQNENGIPGGIWLDGAATVVGRREKFKEYPNSCFFWNEVNVGDSSDIRLLKQTTEGIISYLKFGDLDETKFSGLLICNCNEFVAKGKVGKDLEALRDRADIIEVGAPQGYSPELALEAERHYLPPPQAIDWQAISTALVRETDEILTEEERNKIRPYWGFKVRECLDGRVLTRAGKDFIDCFIFMKRYFGDLNDPEIFHAAIGLAYDSVTISPLPVAHLTITQRDIVEALCANIDKTLAIGDIRKKIFDNGRFTGNTTLYRHLNKLVEAGFIIRTGFGEYSLLKQDTQQDEDEHLHRFNELLEALGH